MRTLAERFWEKVAPGPYCWEWAAAMSGSGYGKLWHEGRLQQAHRVAWRLCRGLIPPGMQVLHRCDNKRCVRPSHLFLGSQTDNVADMIAKHRARPRRGEESGRARLTESVVREARRLRAAGVGLRELARRYGVPYPTLRHAIVGNSWRHVA